MKVLIVDDKSENLYLLESILKGSGYITVSANNGAEALGLARKDIPDLIITDILMPVMDGFTLCREIKKDEKLCNVPFIFYTATYSDPRDEELALNLGADRFILKPRDPEEFIAIVKDLLKEEKKKNIIKTEVSSIPETVILKEYNEALVRKLEDKMLKLTQSEKEIKKNNILLLKETEERNRAEELLRKSEERFRSLYENSTIGLYRTTPEGKILLANPTLVKLLGYSSFEELASRDLNKDGFEPDYDRRLFIERIDIDGEVKGFESAWTRKDGTTVYVLESAKAIRDSKGQTLYYDGSVEDITKRRIAQDALNESELRFKQISDYTEEWIWEVDKYGLYTYSSPIVKNILGYELEELVGKKYFYDFFDPEIKEDLMQGALGAFANKASFKDFVNCNIHKDGRKIILSTSGIPIVDKEGNLIGYRGVDVDITERKLMENELRESEAKLNEAMQIAMLGTWEYDVDSEQFKFNDQFYKIMRTTAEREGGYLMSAMQYAQKFVHPDDISVVGLETNKALETTDPNYYSHLDHRIIFADGDEGYVSVNIRVDKDSLGRTVKTYGVNQNITERKLSTDALSASEAKFRSYVDYSPQGIFVVNAKGQYIDANEAALKQIGWSKEYLLQKTIADILPEEELEKGLNHFNKLVKEGKSVDEFSLLKTNGEKIDVILDTVKISDDQFLGFSTDITERKRVESELIASKEKAEEMNRLKSNFLANMSHELRTPLMGILGYADFLRQDAESEEKREMAETIFKSGKRLSETLNLILDLSRIETEKTGIKYQKVDLVSKAIEIISLFNKTAIKKGLSLISSFSQDSIIINFEERTFHSILNNLINNAIKFTSEGSVTISISLNNDFVEIKVIDTGIGIAEKDYKTIFEEFRQVSEGYNRNFEGSGLGLNITKKLVEKFGGTITVESEIEKGTTFKVILPLINTEEKRKEPIGRDTKIILKSEERKSVKPLALLVDDDSFVFTVLKRYASEYIELETTVDADFAIKMLKKKQYDLIFMDINLRRGMDGKEATKKIRSMKGYANIPIIATTAYAMLGDKEEFLTAGCTHYLSKPFSKLEIEELLEKVFKLV